MSRCILSALSPAKNLLAYNVIQATFCLFWFPRQMDDVDNEYCWSDLHQNPDQYQNLDKIYSKFWSSCRIPRSPEGCSDYSGSTQCVSSDERSGKFRSASEILQVRRKYVKSAHWYFILERLSDNLKVCTSRYQEF